MLAFLFTLAVLASLGTTALIGLDILPASPLVMSVVVLSHGIFAIAFFRGYGGYRALHRLVHEGRGELYDIAVSHAIARGYFREFREHYALRRVEGLALCGMSLRALDAAEELRGMCVSASAKSSLAAVAAEAEANLELGRLAWAHHALVRADGVKGQESHAGIQAMRGRLAHLRGDHQGALTLLEGVTRKGEWPLKGSVTARNQAWYAEALEASGRREAAIDAYQAATRAAPRSFWGRRAERKARLLL